MSNFQPLKLKQYPKTQERETNESKFWKSFQLSKEEKLVGSPNTIEFNPMNDSQYIITSSSSVHLYESYPDRLQRSFTRFQGDAYSGKYRKDGKLIVAGDIKGNIKVFDVHSKSLLREFRGHTSAVHSTIWSSSGLQLFSGSDDQTVKVWDLGTQESLWSRRNAHTDYIRTMDSNPIIPEIFVSGSYDHTLKLWDTRQKQFTHTFNHGSPVEFCKISSSGTLLFSTGSNEVKVWDILTGNLINTLTNHQKNVTGLCLDSNSSRLLSYGLDGHIKVYSLETFEVKYGFKYSEPILSMGLSKNTNKLVIGFVNGNVMIRNKSNTNVKNLTTSLISSSLSTISSSSSLTTTNNNNNGNNNSSNNNSSNNNNITSSSRYYRGVGVSHIKKSYDDVVETERSQKLHQYDMLFKQFRYYEVLDYALKSRNPLIVITVLYELCRRNSLTIALNGRNEITIEPILSFCCKYITIPKYCNIIVHVIHRILDVYQEMLSNSKQTDKLDELLHKLKQFIKYELVFHRQIMKIMGILDTIMNVGMIKGNNNFEVINNGTNLTNQIDDSSIENSQVLQIEEIK